MIIAHKHNSKVAFGNKYKNGSFCIRIRVTYGGKRTDLHTKLSTTEKQWNSKAQRYKQGVVVGGVPYNILNSTLDGYLGFIDSYFNKASLREEVPTLEDLKKQFNYTFKQSNGTQSAELFFVFDNFIETRSETRHWSKSYKDSVIRTRNYLQKFKPDIRFCDFSTETMNKFLLYLSQTMYNNKVVKVLTMLKEFLKHAKNKNYPVNKEFFEYDPVLPQSKLAVKYLSVEELKTIINLKFDDGSALDMVRDFFIFQCFTALRYSDIKKFKHENIKQLPDGTYEMDILTEKDDDRIPFPLSKVATRIYEKYKDNIYENNVVFPIISNQKYNKHLDEIGKQAGIKGEWIDYQYRLDKCEIIKTPRANISSHSARRTFVVTALNEGVSLDLVAQITSHADIRVMKPYIASTRDGKQMVIDALDNATQV